MERNSCRDSSIGACNARVAFPLGKREFGFLHQIDEQAAVYTDDRFIPLVGLVVPAYDLDLEHVHEGHDREMRAEGFEPSSTGF
jgi:hypothetical protein